MKGDNDNDNNDDDHDDDDDDVGDDPEIVHNEDRDPDPAQGIQLREQTGSLCF